MKTLLMLNPHAAGGRAGRLAGTIEEALSNLGPVDLYRTRGPGDARRTVQSADLGRYGAVVAAGGDGTLFEVLNGLCSNAASARPPLGVLPIGTGNAFSRDLGLQPGDWRAGVDVLAAGHTRRFDTGRVEWSGGAYHFLNIVGAGLPVDVMDSTQRLKVLGRSAYTLATLWKAMQMRCYPLRITLDGHTIERDCLFIEVANTRYTGTSFLIAPGARPDDGTLDVVLVSRLSRLRVLQLFPSIYSGRHIQYDEVETFRAKEIRIEADTALGLAPDGETEGTMPVTISCRPLSVKLFCKPV